MVKRKGTDSSLLKKKRAKRPKADQTGPEGRLGRRRGPQYRTCWLVTCKQEHGDDLKFVLPERYITILPQEGLSCGAEVVAKVPISPSVEVGSIQEIGLYRHFCLNLDVGEQTEDKEVTWTEWTVVLHSGPFVNYSTAEGELKAGTSDNTHVSSDADSTSSSSSGSDDEDEDEEDDEDDGSGAAGSSCLQGNNGMGPVNVNFVCGGSTVAQSGAVVATGRGNTITTMQAATPVEGPGGPPPPPAHAPRESPRGEDEPSWGGTMRCPECHRQAPAAMTANMKEATAVKLIHKKMNGLAELKGHASQADVNAWVAATLGALVLGVSNMETQFVNSHNALVKLISDGVQSSGGSLLSTTTRVPSRLASLLGFAPAAKTMRQAMLLEKLLERPEVEAAYREEAAFKTGKTVREAAVRLVNWVFDLQVQRQMNYSGTIFTPNDIAEGVNVIIDANGEPKSHANKISVRDCFPQFFKITCEVLVHMRGYDVNAKVGESVAESELKNAFYNTRDKQKTSQGMGRVRGSCATKEKTTTDPAAVRSQLMATLLGDTEASPTTPLQNAPSPVPGPRPAWHSATPGPPSSQGRPVRPSFNSARFNTATPRGPSAGAAPLSSFSHGQSPPAPRTWGSSTAMNSNAAAGQSSLPQFRPPAPRITPHISGPQARPGLFSNPRFPTSLNSQFSGHPPSVLSDGMLTIGGGEEMRGRGRTVQRGARAYLREEEEEDEEENEDDEEEEEEGARGTLPEGFQPFVQLVGQLLAAKNPQAFRVPEYDGTLCYTMFRAQFVALTSGLTREEQGSRLLGALRGRALP
ncbi:uncharacterized protein LOC117650715 [Thrips palmi]|uniref:Uncharacterized protein LOC117650715 n=1 Tax=Thrips palmi TaxID=161013 RepID=A0A6P8ZXP9_THRPL|nr:uncharacterized protein LOC117650715 [Thrips palmi]